MAKLKEGGGAFVCASRVVKSVAFEHRNSTERLALITPLPQARPMMASWGLICSTLGCWNTFPKPTYLRVYPRENKGTSSGSPRQNTKKGGGYFGSTMLVCNKN